MASVAPTDAPGLLEAPSGPAPIAWALRDDKAGMASQALGLAEPTGFPFIETGLGIHLRRVCLPLQLCLVPFRTAGYRREFATALARSGRRPRPECSDAGPGDLRAGGGHTVAAQIQNPGIGRRRVRPVGRVQTPSSPVTVVIATRVAAHRATQASLAAERYRFPALATMPRPLRSVLMGTNRAYRAMPRRGDEIAEALAGILCSGGGLARISGENPYFAYLALADAVLVTDSSVSMISEAAATGKPVHVRNLDGSNAKLARFHEAIRAAAGITGLFSGRIESWSDRVPDDTMLAGAALQALALGRRTRA